MAKSISDPLWAELPMVNGQHRRLLDIESAVDPTGDSAVLRLSFDRIFTIPENIHVAVNFADIGRIAEEIHNTASVMTARRVTLGGEMPLSDLFRAAMRPSSIDVALDPSGDSILLFRFDGRAPIAIALTDAEVNLGIAKLRRTRKRDYH